MNTRRYLEGESSKGYTFFGCHKRKEGDYIFRILAPNAKELYLSGDFNNWNKDKARKYSTGIFSIRNTNVKNGDRYCYYIEDKDSNLIKKLDPYASEIDPSLSYSVITDNKYNFKYKKVKLSNLNIFQVHLQSYLDILDENLYFKEKVKNLIIYLKDNNFNYIELFPIIKTKDIKSYGFRPINLFTIDNELSTILEFKEFVDLCHKNKIGIILNFDFSEFDDIKEGLLEFDGTKIFENDNDNLKYNYFSCINFDFSKKIVKSYILSAVEYWIKEFQIDIIKYANIEKIIYWQGDVYRGINKNGYDLIKKLNRNIHSLKSESLASTSSNFNIIDYDLDFDYIEDMSIRKIIKILQKDPFYRNSFKKTVSDIIIKENKSNILGMNYLDSVIESCSAHMKMNGEKYKLDQYKSLMTFIYTIKSNKMLFKGQEKASLEEWKIYKRKNDELDDFEKNFLVFFKKITSIYCDYKAFYHKDSIIKPLDIEGYSIYAYKRIYKNEEFVIIINFSDMDYNIKLNEQYYLIFDTNSNKENNNLKLIDTIKIPKFASLILRK